MKIKLLLSGIFLLSMLAGHSQVKPAAAPAASPERIAYLQAKNAQAKRKRFWMPGEVKDDYGNDHFHADEGFKTELQKASAGKVLFSKASTTDAATASQMTNSFTSDDHIYMRAFMETDAFNYICYNAEGADPGSGKTPNYNELAELIVLIHFEDTDVALRSIYMRGDLSGKITFQSVLYGDGADADLNNRDFVACMTNAGPGKHTVKIEVWPVTSFRYFPDDPAATGEFVWDNKHE